MQSPAVPEPHVSLAAEAMATTFRVVVAREDRRYARQAAAAALAELEWIETRLSRFREASDVQRLTRLTVGTSAVVSPETFACLEIADSLRRATDGAFDVAYASLPRSAEPWFELDRARHAVRVLRQGLHIDLGGIGKGLALDRMAQILAEWDVCSALLAAGSSTLLALDPPPNQAGWPVAVGRGQNPLRTSLCRRAVSASGCAIKGDHIIDPRSGQAALGRSAACAFAPSGALADALSTAFMLMSREQIDRYCRQHPDVTAYLPT